MPRRPQPVTAESPEDRRRVEEQTARNLEGMEAEQAGRLDEAVALYERNAAEAFPGDWPYGRLVAIYERREAYQDAERVLERAIEVFQASTRRTPQDRRTMIQVFKRRLALLRRRLKAAAPSTPTARPRAARRSSPAGTPDTAAGSSRTDQSGAAGGSAAVASPGAAPRPGPANRKARRPSTGASGPSD